MGNVSKNFYRHEFDCKRGCDKNTADVELVALLQAIRDQFGRVTITSAGRCETCNMGSPNSQHLVFKAADIQVENATVDDVADWVEEQVPDKYGVGRYRTHIHVDVRAAKARWDDR